MAPLDHFIITNSERGRGGRCGTWDAEVMRMGDGWVKGGQEWAVIRSRRGLNGDTVRQKKVDVDMDNIAQPQLKSDLPERDANC